MNILYICGVDPDSRESGNAQRTHLLYKALCRLGKVYVLHTDRESADEPGRKMQNRHLTLGHFKRFVNHWCWKFYGRIYPTCPFLLPFAWNLNVAEAFPGVKFDLIVARYLHEPAVVRPWRYGPLWIDIDDHPLQVYETCRARLDGTLFRWFGRILVRFVTNYIVRHCTGCWVSNPSQISCFLEPEKIHVLENVASQPPSEYDPESPRAACLMMVGYMAYEPNFLGADRFLTEVWPLAKARYPDLEFWIVGKGLPVEYAEKWSKIGGVKCLGFVKDLAPLYAKCLATVVPIDSGGGTCIKTMESLAYSRACLSTAFGARGISESDFADRANGLLIYDSAENFVETLSLIVDEVSRKTLERAAKSYADRNFSEERFFRQVSVCTGQSPL